MSNEVSLIKRFFESMSVPLSSIWLESCLNWCKEEKVLAPNYTMKDLQHNILEQWLQLDLREVDLPTLPQNLVNTTHRILTGNFSLQLMKIVDISKPKLWQLQKIRNSNALTKSTQKDSDEVGTANRMLMLTLTDGIQEVEAIEYHPISNLNVNIKPGSKIQLLGPITVRRGRLMLEPRHVKVLGGEIDELLVPNAAENVLARALNLELNPNPTTIESNLFNTEVTENETTLQQRTANEVIQNGPIDSAYRTTSQVNSNREVNGHRMSVDEERRIAEEVELLLDAERSIMNDRPIPQVNNKPKTPDMFDDIEFSNQDLEQLDQIASTNANSIVTSFQNDDDDDIFAKIDIDAHIEKVERETFTKPTTPEIMPKDQTILISKLLERKDFITRGFFKVKAKWKSIVEKLTIDEDEYKLVIKIGDDSGELAARMHTDLISDFAGYYPSVLSSLRHIVETDKTASEKIKQALVNLKDRLVALDDILEILIVRNELPTITKVLYK